MHATGIVLTEATYTALRRSHSLQLHLAVPNSSSAIAVVAISYVSFCLVH